MTKIKFTQLPQPLICTIVSDPTPAEILRTIILSDFDGTDAYEINLMCMDRKYWNAADLGNIFRSTVKPVLVCHYRWDYQKHIDIDEEERIQLLVDAVKWGASGIDLDADAFDPTPGPLEWTEEARRYTLDRTSRPRDWSTDPKAVARQRKVIDEIHALGAEVLMSAHARVHLPVETAVAMGLEMEARGADVAKVVSADMNYEDLLDTLRATIELKKVMRIPFIMMSHGLHSKIGRTVCPMMGSMLAFCTQPISPAGAFALQPPIKMQRAAWDNVEWSLPKAPEEQRWL